MTPAEWIGMGGVAITILLAQRQSNAELARTIQTLFSKRLDMVEADNILRDEWISEIDKKVNEVSGDFKIFHGRVTSEIQSLSARAEKTERLCERRHELRTNPGTVT